MVQQITKGIKISVKTVFNGAVKRGSHKYNAFSYFITIENTSSETVQLIERFWNIYDTLNPIEYVHGEGVVGQMPVLAPNEVYSYQSNCFLEASIGAMKGRYKMINGSTGQEFYVKIPTFQLTTIPTLN